MQLRFETTWTTDWNKCPHPLASVLYGDRLIITLPLPTVTSAYLQFERTLSGRSHLVIDVPVAPVNPARLISLAMYVVRENLKGYTQYLGPVQFAPGSICRPDTPERDVADYLLSLLFGEPALEVDQLVHLGAG